MMQETKEHNSDNIENSIYYAFGFSPWKRNIVKRFLNRKVRFVYFSWQVPKTATGTLILWGNRAIPEGISLNIRTIRLEDGFLRSVGLGADLIQPLSWVIDQTGIYYDAKRPSDLEKILSSTNFDSQLLNRARNLTNRLISAGLTKYNLAGQPWHRPTTSQRIILVVGQVETDASILFGANDIRTNSSLLTTVRREHPEAYIIYKPHPDIVAGLRIQGQLNTQDLCDEIVTEVSMDHLLSQIDEVHVITSLAGFEGLLRGKTVFCYGQPFYAGWGLTIDREVHPRRQRVLTLDELVAGTLLLYPTYVSRTSHQHINAEQALEELIDWRNDHQERPLIIRRILRFFLRRK